MGRWCRLEIPSQRNIPPHISIALEVKIEAAQRCEQLHHILGLGVRNSLGQSGLSRFFQQARCIDPYPEALCRSLTSKLVLNIRSNFERDGHGSLLSHYESTPQIC